MVGGWPSRILPPLCPHIDTNLRIKDIFKNNRWMLENLYTPPPKHISKKFHKFRHLVTHHSTVVGWLWDDMSCPLYTVRSGYKFLLCHFPNSDKGRSAVWRCPTPEKVLFLIWFIMHYTLSTNVVRFNRNLTTSLLCNICGDEEES